MDVAIPINDSTIVVSPFLTTGKSEYISLKPVSGWQVSTFKSQSILFRDVTRTVTRTMLMEVIIIIVKFQLDDCGTIFSAPNQFSDLN
jgi:hypothetical protein